MPGSAIPAKVPREIAELSWTELWGLGHGDRRRLAPTLGPQTATMPSLSADHSLVLSPRYGAAPNMCNAKRSKRLVVADSRPWRD
jgi:hypothetical protein